MLARHEVIEGPGDQAFVSKSNISVVQRDWQPSDPPTTHSLSVKYLLKLSSSDTEYVKHFLSFTYSDITWHHSHAELYSSMAKSPTPQFPDHRLQRCSNSSRRHIRQQHRAFLSGSSRQLDIDLKRIKWKNVTVYSYIFMLAYKNTKMYRFLIHSIP